MGIALPTKVSKRVKADRWVGRLAGRVRMLLFKGPNGPPGAAERWFFSLKVLERRRDRIRYCLRQTLTPTAGDLSSLPLPESLSFLYYLSRPSRLLVTHALALVRRDPRLDLTPFRSTPKEVIERQLALAEIRPTDIVYDIGGGDGRVVIMAAKRYGARGVGVDIDPRRIAESNANARKEGVEHLLTFVRQDAKTIDFSSASVVTLYVIRPGILALRPILQAQLQPGARIVSHQFDMGDDWPPSKTEWVEDIKGITHVLYSWRIGAILYRFEQPARGLCE